MDLLIALDLSESTDRLLRRATGLFGACAGRIWLLHVADPEPDFVDFDADPQVERDQTAERYHEAHCRIQALAGQLREAGFECTALLVQGAYAETITREAERLDVDMIVLGSRGRGRASELLTGSPREAVMRTSQLPVALIPVTADKPGSGG